MRLTVFIALLTIAAAALFAGDGFLLTASHPRLRIKSVTAQRQRSQPLQVTLELAADGKTPVAVAQEQFSVHIYTANKPFLFDGDAAFEASAPKVFTVSPQKPSTLTLTTSTDRFGRRKHWDDLPHGSYTLRVYLNSGKDVTFDYKWLGQTYSDDYKLVVK